MKLMPPPETAPDLEAKVALLRHPRTYPGRPTRVDVIETHMSWVFLTPQHVFKLKKPVRYDYLDFSTLAARKMYCEEELRLNPSLAPGVYLDVVPLARDAAGNTRVEGPGTVIDWLVKMHRLPAERMLDFLIERHALEPADVHAVAESLAHFYKSSKPIGLRGDEYRDLYANKIRVNRAGLRDPVYELPADLINAVHDTQEEFLARLPELFDRRAEDGRIVEGHGDLRPEHVCLQSPPVIFDRLEFNRAFRIIDTADELAYLAMECERLGAPQLESELFGVYRRITGDHPSPQLVCFYKAHRACVRARLAIWHLRDQEKSTWPRWRAVAGEYLQIAQGYRQKF
jgi:aminoglycoside phosphotransferase family enzyme